MKKEIIINQTSNYKMDYDKRLITLYKYILINYLKIKIEEYIKSDYIIYRF